MINTIDPAIVLYMFMLSFIFVIFRGLFEWRRIFTGFYPLFIYVLSLEIQLSRGKGWDPSRWLNPVIFVCLSQAMTWIFNVI